MSMRKTVYLVYQDCAVCGARKEWGEAQLKLADKLKFNIVKKPFYHKDSKELIRKAVFEKGIGSMPFFTDGEKFSYDLSDFVDKKANKIIKTKKVKKGGKNGAGTDAE